MWGFLIKLLTLGVFDMLYYIILIQVHYIMLYCINTVL